MPAKNNERLRAIALRNQGLSYSEIQQRVPVSQASLSLWLSNIPLTENQIKRIAKLSLVGQIAGAKAQRMKRLKKMEELSKKVERELPFLLRDPFFAFGLALYLAEGAKEKPWNINVRVSFSNSNPSAILLMRKWLIAFGNVHEEGFTYWMHIHETADIENARIKWADILDVDPGEVRISIKKHIVRSRHKHDNYIGLIQMRARKSTWLNRRIELWGKGVAKKYLSNA